MSDTKDLLTKSIDSMIDDLFEDKVEKGLGIDLAADSKTTADAAIASAPSMEKDESRGAGRPKQISEVPQKDEDGKRDGEYDASISEDESDKGDENEEAKKQAPSIDQTSEKGRLGGEKSKAPESAPFRKSLSEEEYAEFVAFKKSQTEAEELRKAETAKKEQETLVKSAVAAATESIRKENEILKKSITETQELVKAMASQPRQSKSITGIQSLEKSMAAEEKGEESFSKSEVLDAAFELAKAGKIRDEVVSEIEMTGRCADPSARAAIERKLSGK
jgi:hypothetical protein